MVLSGSRAFLLAPEKGVLILDVSDPSNPKLQGRYEQVHSSSWDFAVNGAYLYVADQLNSMIIVDISEPHNPVQVGRYEPIHITGIAIAAEHAYVAAWDKVEVLDLANPKNPRRLGALHTGAYASDIDVSGNYAYLAYIYGRLTVGHFRIIDIQDPTHPQTVATFGQDVSHLNFHEIAVARNRAFLAAVGSEYSVTIHIFDITDPKHPRLLEILNFPAQIWELLTHEDKLFIAAGEEGLFTYDLTLPSISIHSDSENLILNWSGTGPFQIQQRDSLQTAEWTTIHEPPEDQTQLTLPLAAPARFFRIMRTREASPQTSPQSRKARRT